jgi:hypothetical protein
MSSMVNSFSVVESNDSDFSRFAAATGYDTVTSDGSTSGGRITTADGSLVGGGPECSGFISE